MENCRKQPENRCRGFSLVETLVVVALAAMILIGALEVYNHVRSDTTIILGKLDENRLADEVLQRMAEDVDRIVAPGFDSTMQIRNKLDNGFYTAQLIIENKYYGNQQTTPQIYERVIWQAVYDGFENALLLYRLHGGLNVEDKILDVNKEEKEKSLYIPMASGITFFEIQAVEAQKMIPSWADQTKLPKGIRIGISFAEMEEDSSGQWSVPEDKILYRTVAINRSREITYKFKAKEFDPNDFLTGESDTDDPNSILEDLPEGG